MKRTAFPWYRTPDGSFLIRRSAIALLVVLVWWAARALAQNDAQPAPVTKPLTIRATHLLGFEGSAQNANGTLSIQEDVLQFQKDGKAPAQVKITLVQDIFLGE